MSEPVKQEFYIQKHPFFSVNQIDAASDVLKALTELKEITSNDPSLQAVRETDIYQLRRRLCLPCASGTCINSLFQRKVIGAEKADPRIITIGDFFRLLLPFHNQKNLVDDNNNVYPNPWFVVSKEGDVYHQAVISVAQGLGVSAQSVIGFPNIDVFIPFIKQGGTLAVSLDNHFVLEQTLAQDEELVEKRNDGFYIKIEGPNGLEFRKFQNGRHVIAIVGIDQDSNLIINDSFVLPQMRNREGTFLFSPALVNKYLDYQTGGQSRGIIFYKKDNGLNGLGNFINNQPFIPQVVVEKISKFSKV